MQLQQTLSIALLSLLLFSCGGSLDGDSPTSPTEPTTPTEPTDPVTPTEPTDTDDNTPPIIEDVSGSPTAFSFEGAVPATIAMKGTSGQGRKEASTVTFKLVDSNGSPIAGHEVEFSFELTPPDAELQITSATTDDSGQVSTVVKSGSIAGPVVVRVRSVADAGLYQTSNNLNITTGYPDQDSFSLSATDLAPEGFNYDGTEVSINIRLGGGEANTAVPDGTVVNFRTTGGKITDETGTVSSCSTAGSACSVKWVSQDPRPASGRVLITAYSTGEESFIDKNRDGLYTAGETFGDVSEAFADVDQNGVQNDSEWFNDVPDKDGVKDQKHTAGDGKYTGLQCPEGSNDCVRGLVTIYDSIELVMAGRYLSCRFVDNAGQPLNSVDLVNNPAVSFYVIATDQNNNTPPSGTAISSEVTNGAISGDSSWAVDNSNERFYSFPVTIKREEEDNKLASGVAKFKLTTPLNNVSNCSLPVND